MTTLPSGRVPVFTLGWRLRLALESAEISVQQMADSLGYSRSTVSRWLNDQGPPRAAVLAQWSLLTGVDHGWLTGGTEPTPPRGPGRPTDKLDRLTQQKRERTHTTRSTRQYFQPESIPA